jgi:hypothetical protein
MSAARQSAATPNPYGESTHKHKTISADALDKAVERLSRQVNREGKLEPLTLKEVPKLTTAELDDSAVRLCNASVERKAKKVAELENKFLVDKRPHSVMSMDETSSSVSRLYYGSVKVKQDNRRKLQDKYLAKGVLPDVSKEKVDSSIQHLFYEEKTRRDESRVKLNARYVLSTGPKVGKMRDKAQEAAMLERLFTK